MSSIVIELQRELYDGDKSITDLLRKAYIVARKLKILEFEKWIDAELNGYYSKNVEIPEYRVVRIDMVALNPVRGYIPVWINDEKFSELLSSMTVSQSISEVEALLESDNDYAISKIPPNIENTLQPALNANYPLYNRIDKSQLQGIIEGIKNVILSWSLKLEEDGIMGEGMSFSDKEKELAEKASYTINYFNGNLTNTQIQQHTQNSSQSIQNATIDFEKIKDVIKLIKDNIDKIELENEDLKEVNTRLKDIEKEISSPSPQNGIIKSGLHIIGQVMEKVSVSLIASGIVYQIQQCMKILE